MSANVAFTNNATGAYLEGTYIADTGPTWMVKPDGKPVQVILKAEWTSVQVRRADFGDIFGRFFG